jgi:acetyl esterase/lipase
MRWVRSKAGNLGIDPNRIASGGGSAGGHLAAVVGIMDGLDDPSDDLSVPAKSNAMLLFNPVLDMGPGSVAEKRVGDKYLEYSPYHNIKRGMPPAIVFVGTQDKVVPVRSVEAFCEQARAKGGRCEARVYEGQPHGFFNYRNTGDNRYFKETLQAADEFLTSLGWLK